MLRRKEIWGGGDNFRAGPEVAQVGFSLVLRVLLLLNRPVSTLLPFPDDGCMRYEAERKGHLFQVPSVKSHAFGPFVRADIKPATQVLKEEEREGDSGLRVSPFLPREGSKKHSPGDVA